MSTEFTVFLVGVAYKLACLLVGLALCYMGYKLFMNNIWGQAGDLNASFQDNKIVLKAAAPGTFFALFGTIIVVATVWVGITIDEGGSRYLHDAKQPKKVELPQ